MEKDLKGNDLPYEIGDYVYYNTEDKEYIGKIDRVCDCEKCRERGFLEPVAINELGAETWITDLAYENGFKDYIFSKKPPTNKLSFDRVMYLFEDFFDNYSFKKNEEGVTELVISFKEENNNEVKSLLDKFKNRV